MRLKINSVKKNKCFRALLLLLLFGYLIFSVVNSWNEIEGRFNFRIDYFALIIVLHFVFLVVNAKRFHFVLLCYAGRYIGFARWFRIFIEGRILNKIFPQLGNIYRSYELNVGDLMAHTQFVASYLYMTWSDTILNFSVALVCIFVFRPPYFAIQDVTIFISVFLAILCAAPWALNKIEVRPRSSLVNKIAGKLEQLRSVLRRESNNALLWRISVLGIISFVLMSGRIWMGFKMFNVELEIASLAIMYAFYKLSTMVVVTPGNLGIQELSIGALSEIAGYGLALGVLVSLFLRFCGYLLFLSLWVVFTIGGGGRKPVQGG